MPITRIQLDAALVDEQLPEMETLLDGSSQQAIQGRDDWFIRMGRYWSGLSAEVEVIDVCNGPLSVYVLPTRGMGVWKANLDGLEIGWNSPISQPVHPQFINLTSRNGYAWLEGFNELICRCGLAFNGPPGTDKGAKSPLESEITLHGKISNLPARGIEVFVDEEEAVVGVSGVVEECSLFGPQLRMKSTLTSKIGSHAFTIVDEVTNFGPSPTELELLYHTNIGSPFLEDGAKLEIPTDRVTPRDPQAAVGIQTHADCQGPIPGYPEQVFFYKLLADKEDRTVSMLRNHAGDKAVSLEFSRKQLPYFAFWKCTQDERAGYVAGIEPGTNLPNFKTFEREQGRVISLQPGETYVSSFTMTIHDNAQSVAAMSKRIQEMQGGVVPVLDLRPIEPYSPSA